MSASLRPNRGASTVTTSVPYPAFFALCKPHRIRYPPILTTTDVGSLDCGTHGGALYHNRATDSACREINNDEVWKLVGEEHLMQPDMLDHSSGIGLRS